VLRDALIEPCAEFTKNSNYKIPQGSLKLCLFVLTLTAIFFFIQKSVY